MLLHNVHECTGINRARVEEMEARLKEDILQALALHSPRKFAASPSSSTPISFSSSFYGGDQ